MPIALPAACRSVNVTCSSAATVNAVGHVIRVITCVVGFTVPSSAVVLSPRVRMALRDGVAVCQRSLM